MRARLAEATLASTSRANTAPPMSVNVLNLILSSYARGIAAHGCPARRRQSGSGHGDLANASVVCFPIVMT